MTAFYKNIISKFLITFLSFVFFSFSAVAELNLTKEEKDWVKDNLTVKFTGDPNWLPYEAFKKDGTYVGIVSEHLELIEKLSGLKFETIPVSSWSESLNIATREK